MSDVRCMRPGCTGFNIARNIEPGKICTVNQIHLCAYMYSNNLNRCNTFTAVFMFKFILILFIVVTLALLLPAERRRLCDGVGLSVIPTVCSLVQKVMHEFTCNF